MSQVREAAKERRETVARIRREAPRRGVIIFILYTILMSGNNYVAKMMFETDPTLDVWKLTFARGVIAFTIMMVKINVNVKRELWDGVERSTVPSLVFRCF